MARFIKSHPVIALALAVAAVYSFEWLLDRLTGLTKEGLSAIQLAVVAVFLFMALILFFIAYIQRQNDR